MGEGQGKYEKIGANGLGAKRKQYRLGPEERRNEEETRQRTEEKRTEPTWGTHAHTHIHTSVTTTEMRRVSLDAPEGSVTRTVISRGSSTGSC